MKTFEGCMYSFTPMDVSSHLHDLAALTPGKEP